MWKFTLTSNYVVFEGKSIDWKETAVLSHPQSWFLDKLMKAKWEDLPYSVQDFRVSEGVRGFKKMRKGVRGLLPCMDFSFGLDEIQCGWIGQQLESLEMRQSGVC
ncbi:hypothetical protein L1049_014583 [Liquidambar formosana]|uniref:Uncharacterized protein n=1 Tax=Liquidambar formosana TaxID=63359 RepID=A0AAP0RXG1_LIQFO